MNVDFATQRKNMVESQVRPSDVTDRRITRAMLDVPREAFAPPASRSVAYRDEAFSLLSPSSGPARTVMPARILAKLIQAMDIGERDAVLDIGTGTGYSAAVLAKIADRVIAVETDAALAREASTTLGTLGFANVRVVQGQLAAGHPAEAPYDAILLNGAVHDVPPGLLDQLKDGGRLVAVVREGAVGRATQWRRIGGMFDSRVVFDATVDVLPGFEREAQFVF